MEVFLASLPPGLGSWLVPGDLRAGPRLGVGVQRAGAGSGGGGEEVGGGGVGGEGRWCGLLPGTVPRAGAALGVVQD